MLTILSLGGGVQSSTIALMASHGELPQPDAAIFADTGCEPSPVYEWLAYLEGQLAFPLYRVSAGNLREHVLASIQGARFATAPFFTESDHGVGRLRRQCTREFKLSVLFAKARALAGLAPGERAGRPVVAMQIGISTDEAQRMKPARECWQVKTYPLIEARMSRSDCLAWINRHGYPRPPKSSCTFCPFHNNAQWRWLRDHDPKGWKEACEVDRAIRNGVRGTQQRLYLHRSLTPLEEVDLSTPEENGQIDAFGEKCEGGCGL